MRTSITISDEVGGDAQQVAKRLFRGNFSFLCEQALRAYCEPRVGNPEESELVSAAKELGMDKALAILSRQLVRTTRPAVRSRRAA